MDLLFDEFKYGGFIALPYFNKVNSIYIVATKLVRLIRGSIHDLDLFANDIMHLYLHFIIDISLSNFQANLLTGWVW